TEGQGSKKNMEGMLGMDESQTPKRVTERLCGLIILHSSDPGFLFSPPLPSSTHFWLACARSQTSIPAGSWQPDAGLCSTIKSLPSTSFPIPRRDNPGFTPSEREGSSTSLSSWEPTHYPPGWGRRPALGLSPCYCGEAGR